MSNGHHGRVHTMPVKELAKWLPEYNLSQSAMFISPDTALKRRQYRAKHSTEILAFECMDGRVHTALMTQTPPGIIQRVRNLGGIFDLGWDVLDRVVAEFVGYAIKKGRKAIILVTYHWSQGCADRGCRGFNYDAERARDFTLQLAAQISRVYGERHETVYPVRIGVETDTDICYFHGVGDQVLNPLECFGEEKAAIRKRVERLYPDMPPQMIRDLVPLVMGNAQHAYRVQSKERRETDSEHCERVLVVGRGSDWLHMTNLALLVGPFDPNLDKAIEIAACLLLENIKSGLVPDDGIVLLGSAVYRDHAGPDRSRAEERARFLTRFALQVIREHVPELGEKIISVTGIVDNNTRELHIL